MEQYDIEVKANTSSFAGLVSDNKRSINLFKYIKKVFDYLKTTPGTVLKSTMFDINNITIISNDIGLSTSSEVFMTCDYTPISANSNLFVEIFILKYQMRDVENADWASELSIKDSDNIYPTELIASGYQELTGLRVSSCLFPLLGKYTNNSLSVKQIQVAAKQITATTGGVIYPENDKIYIKVTEVAR